MIVPTHAYIPSLRERGGNSTTSPTRVLLHVDTCLTYTYHEGGGYLARFPSARLPWRSLVYVVVSRELNSWASAKRDREVNWILKRKLCFVVLIPATQGMKPHCK